MTSFLYLFGLLIGCIGAAICIAAGANRLMGAYHLMGFEASTLFLAGTSAMVFACMLRLYRRNDKH